MNARVRRDNLARHCWPRQEWQWGWQFCCFSPGGSAEWKTRFTTWFCVTRRRGFITSGGFTCWPNMHCGWPSARMFPFPCCLSRSRISLEIHAQLGPKAAGGVPGGGGRDYSCNISRVGHQGTGSARISLPWRDNSIAPAFQLQRCDWKRRRRHVDLQDARAGSSEVQHGACDNDWTPAAGEPEGNAGAGGPGQKPPGESAERDAGELIARTCNRSLKIEVLWPSRDRKLAPDHHAFPFRVKHREEPARGEP